MPSTYEPIFTHTSSGTIQEYTFTSIPQTYTDLYVIRTGASNAAVLHDITWRANGDTGNNYAFVRVLAEAASNIYTDRNGAANQVNCNQSGSGVSFTWLQIFNYSSSTMFKGSILKTNCNGSSQFTMASGAGTWKNTAPITSLTIRNEQGLFAANSVFTLYGILKA